MKLSFFEKEVFDSAAIEKPTVTTNDKGESDVNKVKSDYKDPFIAEESKEEIRGLRIGFEYLPFFVDGTSFKGKFKHTSITSGEPEINSRTQSPLVTKRIDVNLRNTVELQQLSSEAVSALPETGLTIPRRVYSPSLLFCR